MAVWPERSGAHDQRQVHLMNELTDDELDGIERRAAAATPGPCSYGSSTTTMR
jgi:hypothetical protein